jgi:hypothetical protein
MLRQWGFRQSSYGYLLVAVCLLTVVSACSLLRIPKHEVSIVSEVVAPLSVKAREPFTITLYTEAGRPRIPDRVEVRVSGLDAEIIPYDAIEQSHITYLMSRIDSPRSVSLQFDTPGIATIRVMGRGAQGQPSVQQAVVNVLPP